MATYEASPYFSSEMPDQGAAAYAIKEMLKKQGYSVKFSFYPVRRAKLKALRNSEDVALTPCSDYDVIPGLILSDSVFQTTSVLIERKSSPILWSKTQDLTSLNGSLVRGFSLKGPMKAAFDKGQLKIEEVPDDTAGILKVANGRSDYHAMVDSMYKFLIEHDPRLKKDASKVQINSKPVARVFWGACFKEKDERSLRVLKAFNSSANKQEFAKDVVTYLKKLESPKKTF